MTNISRSYNPAEITALDNLAKYAICTIRLDESDGAYVVEDKATGAMLGRYETYRDARRAAK